MSSVGLLFVGAVLFINGLMLMGLVEPRSAAPMNFFVGVLQIITPTYLIFTAHGDENVILGASGLYLFAFTYLYVGLNLTFNLDSTGLGYFCAFVAVCALVFAGLNFGRFGDNGFGVIWLYWAFLWALFFLLLGRKRESLTMYTGAVCAIQGWVTATIPAFLLLTGHWTTNRNVAAIGLAIFAVVVFGLLYPRLRSASPTTVSSPAPNAEALGA